jgi:hypothetical protein
MTKFDTFLKNNDLEGTATNKYGEFVYLGKARALKHVKNGYNINWDVPQSDQISPFDRVILHNGEKIFGVLNMPPFRVNGCSKIQVSIK